MTSSLLSFPSSQFNCRSAKSSQAASTDSDFYERRICAKRERDSKQPKRQPTYTADKQRFSLSDLPTCRPHQYRLYIGRKSQEHNSHGDNQVDGARLQVFSDARPPEGCNNRALTSLEYAIKVDRHLQYMNGWDGFNYVSILCIYIYIYNMELE